MKRVSFEAPGGGRHAPGSRRHRPAIGGVRPVSSLGDVLGTGVAPPPRVIVRPKKKAGTILIAWELGGRELVPSTEAGLGVDVAAPVTSFSMEVDLSGVSSTFPITHAVLWVRNLPSEALHKIGMRLEANRRLSWTLDDEPIDPVRIVPPKITLPPEFFGEYLGALAEDATGRLSPILRIEW